jgi:3-oxoadipate CoA-transferase alpha subunit
MPFALVDALIERRPRDLTLVTNNTGTGHTGIAALLEAGLVRKVICCYPRREGSVVFERLYASGAVELELVPQGTLCERIRAAAAGLGGFYTPTAAGTALAQDKETRRIDGRDYVLELPIRADMALIRARLADRWGNLVYHETGRNMGPVMAGAAAITAVEVDGFVALGELDPERIVTPGIFVDRVVAR